MELLGLLPLMVLMLAHLGTGEGCDRIVCYYTNWAQHRPAPMNFFPHDVNEAYCTHLMFAFADIVDNRLTHLEWNIDHGQNSMYKQFNQLKNTKPGLKTLLTVNGQTSGVTNFTAMIRNPASRKTFISHSIKYLRDRQFDGLDLHWEYPASRNSPGEDKQKFADLVRELRKAYDEEAKDTGNERLLLTAAMAAAKAKMDKGSEITAIFDYLDFISVRSYDFHGPRDKVTAHHAPLYRHDNDEAGETAYSDMDSAAQYWVQLGVPREKLNLGVSFSGRSFKLRSVDNNGLGAAVDGAGRAGNYTRDAGTLSYYEICQLRGQGYDRFIVSQDVPYFHLDDLWVGYDSPISLRRKVDYIKDQGFGGVMVWSLDMDDFNGRVCNGGHYPLLSAVGDECRKPALTAASRKTRDAERRCKRVVCYYAAEAQTRPTPMKLTPAHINASSCTHIVYAFVDIQDNVLTPANQNEDESIAKFNEVKLSKLHLKSLVAVGGEDQAATRKLSTMAQTNATRQKFIKAGIHFCRERNFDGLDLHWRSLGAEDKAHFSALVVELKIAFDLEVVTAKVAPLLLTVTVDYTSKEAIMKSYNISELYGKLDFINVATYNVTPPKGPGVTKYSWPLRDPTDSLTVENALKAWSTIIPKVKLNVGLATFGRSSELADSTLRGLGDKTVGPATAGYYTQIKGINAYYEICDLINKGAQTAKADVHPYLMKDNIWITYDNAESLRKKIVFVKEQEYGGVFVWTLDFDDFAGRFCNKGQLPLMSAISDECGINEETPVGSVTPENPMKYFPFLCKGKGHYERVANPYDCHRYIVCIFGRIVQMACPHKKYYDIAGDVCIDDKPKTCKLIQISPDLSQSSTKLASLHATVLILPVVVLFI